jgi:hypothetical protein
MLTIDKALQPPKQTIPTHRTPFLGQLNRLPPEILSMIISALDVQAAERMAQVSFMGNLLVRSHPHLRDLKKSTPDALAALATDGIISLHSIHQLHATLRSDRCATCPAFGPFLFLLTSERCCLECIRYSPV